MAKTSKKRVTTKSRKTSSKGNYSLLDSSSNGPWGKDQPMILILSSGIIILIVVTLFLTGWLQ